uniref:p0648C09.17 protein n=1 Tax=Oryza sativa subsp. japonica TaxID=39947 RepID=Q8RYY3_ORYSJ|nr:P0648C09.17 [Oryza sativa Japonica Group]
MADVSLARSLLLAVLCAVLWSAFSIFETLDRHILVNHERLTIDDYVACTERISPILSLEL